MPNESATKPTAEGGPLVLLRREIDQRLSTVTKLLAETKLSPERFMQSVYLALKETRGLENASPASVVFGVIRAAQLGLSIGGPAPLAHLIPRRDRNDENRVHAHLLVGFRGLVHLARQTGDVVTVQGRPVREGDEFSLEYTPEPKFHHREGFTNAPAKLFYCVAWFADPRAPQHVTVVTRDEVERIRNGVYEWKKTPWADHFDEMGVKTAMRRGAKQWPLSAIANRAIGLAMAHADVTTIPETLGSPQDGEDAAQDGATGDVPKADKPVDDFIEPRSTVPANVETKKADTVIDAEEVPPAAAKPEKLELPAAGVPFAARPIGVRTEKGPGGRWTLYKVDTAEGWELATFKRSHHDAVIKILADQESAEFVLVQNGEYRNILSVKAIK